MAHVWIIFGEMLKCEAMKKRASAHVQKFPTATLPNHHETHSCNHTATNEDFPTSLVTGFYMKLNGNES